MVVLCGGAVLFAAVVCMGVVCTGVVCVGVVCGGGKCGGAECEGGPLGGSGSGPLAGDRMGAFAPALGGTIEFANGIDARAPPLTCVPGMFCFCMAASEA